MIERMSKYNFILLNSDKEDFLRRIQELGVVDITRSTKPVDDNSSEMMDRIVRMKAALAKIATVDWSKDDDYPKVLEYLKSEKIEEGDAVAMIEDAFNELHELEASLEAEKKNLKVLYPWGNFDVEKLKELKDEGVDIRLYVVPAKKYEESWSQKWPVELISEVDGNIYLASVGDSGIPAKEIEIPKIDVEGQNRIISGIEDRVSKCKAHIGLLKGKSPEMEREYEADLSGLNLYLAGISGTSAAENQLCLFEGFTPTSNDEEVCSALDTMDVYYTKEIAKQADNPPIKLKNNKFSSMFEVFTGMYGMPVYSEFDPTAILGPFFLLFFAFCMGDAGYGILLMLISSYLKNHDILGMGLSKHRRLVFFLGLSTFLVGSFLGTFFGMPLADQSWVPSAFKKCILNGTVMGYDLQMVLAVGIGVFHICFAMTIKAICYTQRFGFRQTVSSWGWLLVIVGGLIIAALALLGVMSSSVTKVVVIAVGILAALGIYVFNTPGRNPLLNIGSGLWETYNMASGLLGDALSYIRLYALGIAGGMLGGAFNDLGLMVLDSPIPGVNWLGCIIILVAGHALNLAMSCLGAFVHPLRLTFVEYFKNSGYEGKGAKFNPLKSNIK